MADNLRSIRSGLFSTSSPMNRFLPAVAACCLALAQAGALAQRAPSLELPGERPDGSVLLPNQWSLRPAGRQIPLGDLPVNIALHPAGQFAAVLHSGHARHQIAIVDVKAGKVISRTTVPEAFYGLEFSRKGTRLFCSGAGDEVIHLFDFKRGNLTRNSEIHLRDARQ